MPDAPTDFDDRMDGLYAVPLDEFVAARDALARELRTGGDRDAAARVKALRKPSRVAWAVNQAARSAPNGVDDLGAAGAELLRAQQQAMKAGAGAELRDATAGRTRAVRALADIAVDLLGPTGASARDAIEQTFEAASVDDVALSEVRAARLVAELEPPDIFASLEPVSGGAPGRRTTRADEEPADKEPDDALAREVADARIAAVAAAEALDAAKRRADALDRDARSAAEAAAAARNDEHAAGRRARAARERLEQAERAERRGR